MSGGSAGAWPIGGGTSGTPRAPGGYVVEGHRILDESHASVRLRGAALPSLIWDPTGSVIAPRDFEMMAAWGINVVRIGLNQGFWLAGGPACTSDCYRTRVAEVVGLARKTKLDVILDLHWATANGAVPPQFLALADRDSVTFWSDVATRYAGDGRVLFELYNEPHDIDWSTWKNGGQVTSSYDPDTSDTDYSTPGSITYEAAGMQALYAAVRATGAHNLVIAGGLDWSFDLSGVPEHGIDGYNVVYATHLYPFSTKLPDAWPNAFGFLRDQVPLVVSEFGPANTIDPDCPPGYADDVLAYTDETPLHWVAWDWFAAGSPDDPYPACESAFFFSEADPARPVYALTPFGERIQRALVP